MKIFEQSSIGNMTLKNRLWRSATWTASASEEGYVTPELKELYRELAAGGVGTIVTEFTVITKEEQPYPKMLNIYSDDFIDGYKGLTEMIHSYETNVVMQLGYGGSTAMIPAEGRTVWGPSEVVNPISGIVPVEMSIENITELVEAMGEAARRAKEAGFDGVQIHGGHGYLFSQFLSPYFNTRTDEYGGCIENRARIILETLASIKKHAGHDFPTYIKMHTDDQWGENGFTEKESLWLSKKLEGKGISGIEFSGGNIDPANGNGPARGKLFSVEDQSYFKEQTTRIASELEIPVISVGGHRNTKMMEEILNNSNINYLALSRTLHSEPDLPNKWLENPEVKVKCVSCNKCLTSGVNTCILNR